MKKAFFVLVFFSFAYGGFAQEENKHRFTHTLTENFGLFYWNDGYSIEIYASTHDAYSFLNLIPSYEVGYNNDLFLRFKYRIIASISADNGSFRSHLLVQSYSLTISYNFLFDTSPHSLKLGLGLSEIQYRTKFSYPASPPLYRESIDYFNFISSLSYSYKLNKHFSIGGDIDVYNYRFSLVEISVALGYTF